MTAPANVESVSGAPDQPKKSQKDMTKAERRELQERQRATKLALKTGATSGSSSTTTSTQLPPASASSKSKPQTQSQKKGTGEGHASSSGAKSAQPKDSMASSAPGEDTVSRGLKIFSHFGLPRPTGHMKGDIHPAIIKLGLLFSDFRICGSNARCIATLTAFKTVIQDYTTPPQNTLSRHLMTHLSPQITYLVSARPMSVTMGNAIRQLKLEISNSDIDIIEQDAKDALCEKIDDYIRDRIIIADEVIQELAGNKIKDSDVILTFARSSIVEKILIHAHEQGKRFSVIVVDSRPLLEGKTLLKRLTTTEPPIPCTYILLSVLASVIKEVTTVLLGAHSLSANGAVYSRAGTAMVAMLAKTYLVPVMVCCETYKFSEGVMLDGFGKNELARVSKSTKNSQGLLPSVNLEILNPLYDLTPPTCITAVVTEVGLIPPNSISSIPLALGKTTL